MGHYHLGHLPQGASPGHARTVGQLVIGGLKDEVQDAYEV